MIRTYRSTGAAHLRGVQAKMVLEKKDAPRTDANLLEMILDMCKRRPFYGTRRVAAELAHRLGKPVNRKRVRRVYRLAG